jgi:hypothetical protein
VSRRFVGESVEPLGILDAAATLRGEPAMPAAFRWHDRELRVQRIDATRRGLKADRGDVYLKRHYVDFVTPEGELVTVYFDRAEKRWWLYAIEAPLSS